VAAGSIVSGFGEDLANDLRQAQVVPLPTNLNGVQLSITDSSGIERETPLFFTAPNQINYAVSPDTANGPATVTVTRYGVPVALGALEIDAVGPGLFTANANGQGVPVAAILWVRPSGAQESELVYDCSEGVGNCEPIPIDLGPANGQAYMTLYGTGIRGRSSLEGVRVTIGGRDVPVLYAGDQGFFVGVDQLNIQLPPELAGSGRVLLRVTVDGRVSNEVVLEFL
jgi:uncharacterized protein (TIGR03437 family)